MKADSASEVEKTSEFFKLAGILKTPEVEKLPVSYNSLKLKRHLNINPAVTEVIRHRILIT